MSGRSWMMMVIVATTATITSVAASGPSCAQANKAVAEAQTRLSQATRAKNRAASALHRCMSQQDMSRAGGRSGVCKAQRSAFERASAAHHDAGLALRFAVSQRKAACR